MGTCWSATATVSILTQTSAGKLSSSGSRANSSVSFRFDAMPGGAFGLSLVQLYDNQVRFAAVDDVAIA
jgi:hypothetical protein